VRSDYFIEAMLSPVGFIMPSSQISILNPLSQPFNPAVNVMVSIGQSANPTGPGFFAFIKKHPT
jgi:hypothetical protein